MRGSFTVAGIEVAVRADGRALEQAILTLLGPYLSDVRRPVCRLSLRRSDEHVVSRPSAPAVDIEGTTLHIRHNWFAGIVDLEGEGQVEVVPHAAAVAQCLQLIWSAIALRHGTIMVAATGLVVRGRAHLVMAADSTLLRRLVNQQDLPLLSRSRVALAPTGDGWIGASTPFGGEDATLSRRALLAAIWRPMDESEREVVPLGGAAAFAAVVASGILPAAEPQFQQLLFDRAADLARVVPAGALRLDRRTRWDVVDGLASALEVRRKLLTWEQPTLSSQLLEQASHPDAG